VGQRHRLPPHRGLIYLSARSTKIWPVDVDPTDDAHLVGHHSLPCRSISAIMTSYRCATPRHRWRC
jgi:hypothetical protein